RTRPNVEEGTESQGQGQGQGRRLTLYPNLSQLCPESGTNYDNFTARRPPRPTPPELVAVVPGKRDQLRQLHAAGVASIDGRPGVGRSLRSEPRPRRMRRGACASGPTTRAGSPRPAGRSA